MRTLINEFEYLKRSRFMLDFNYPNDDLLSKLRIVHRDLSPQEKQRLENKKNQLASLLRDLESGELHPEDLEDETRERLKKLLEKKG